MLHNSVDVLDDLLHLTTFPFIYSLLRHPTTPAQSSVIVSLTTVSMQVLDDLLTLNNIPLHLEFTYFIPQRLHTAVSLLVNNSVQVLADLLSIHCNIPHI